MKTNQHEKQESCPPTAEWQISSLPSISYLHSFCHFIHDTHFSTCFTTKMGRVPELHSPFGPVNNGFQSNHLCVEDSPAQEMKGWQANWWLRLMRQPQQ